MESRDFRLSPNKGGIVRLRKRVVLLEAQVAVLIRIEHRYIDQRIRMAKASGLTSNAYMDRVALNAAELLYKES